MNISGIMLAAPSSGSGKTVASCGIMAGLRQMNKKVRSCKCGPDYIDPMFHREALNVESENLDLFFCGRDEMRSNFYHHAREGDITVVEGSMGYYDGMSFGSVEGSAYEIAKALRLPVILVLPCRGMAASVLAVLKGMIEYRQDSNIRGIILNRISPALYPKMKKMIQQGLQKMGHSETEVVGYLPEDDSLSLSSRHLGLVTPEEITGIRRQMDRAGALLLETLDMEKILEIAESAGDLEYGKTLESETKGEGTEQREKIRVAVAKDKAFCFYYKDNLEYLKKLGCELVFFSPLEDKRLPRNCKGLILGGGYPELYAKELAANRELMKQMKEEISKGLPCLAECGGFLYLQDHLEDAAGDTYQMAGVISSSSSNRKKLVRFGYVSVEGKRDGAYLKQGEKIRGHEFHYWDSEKNGESCLAVKPDGRSWDCVHMEKGLFAGYPHLYYPSNPKFARRFVEACRSYRREREDQ